MTISGERTEQLDILCCTGFMSDFCPPQMSADICVGMTISGERTEQLDIFCHVFASDFLSFIDVELIRFFHGSLQLTNVQCAPDNITTDNTRSTAAY